MAHQPLTILDAVRRELILPKTQSRESQAGFFETVRNEMRLRNYSHKTIKSYLSCLRAFVAYFRPKHPRAITEEEIKTYLLHLIQTKHFAASSVNQTFNALWFLYAVLYDMPFRIGNVPRPRKEKKLPDVFTQDEVTRLFKAVPNPKHRMVLLITYSAGLRLGEPTRLRPEDIDTARKMIHIRGAKGEKTVTRCSLKRL